MRSLLKKSNLLKIYNVGSQYNLDVISLVKKIGQYFPKKKIKINVKNSSRKEIYFQKLDYRKISKELNWKPITNLNEGLMKTIKWYMKHKNLFNVV